MEGMGRRALRALQSPEGRYLGTSAGSVTCPGEGSGTEQLGQVRCADWQQLVWKT